MSETEASFETRSRPVLENLLAGLTEGEAAAKHGISERTIQRWLARGAKTPSRFTGSSPRSSTGRAWSASCLQHATSPPAPEMMSEDAKFALGF